MNHDKITEDLEDSKLKLDSDSNVFGLLDKESQDRMHLQASVQRNYFNTIDKKNLRNHGTAQKDNPSSAENILEH